MTTESVNEELEVGAKKKEKNDSKELKLRQERVKHL